MPALTTEPSDQELIGRVRAGSSQAYRTLYQRHRAVARNRACQLAPNSAVADDLVAEAFTRVLAALRGQGGPISSFRAYLLTTLRNVAYENHRRDRNTFPQAEITELAVADGTEDQVLAKAERSAIAAAFDTLPQRWRTVLWYTAIEGRRHTQVAALLGLTPNGVAALAYRAREGLRQAYRLSA